jgi:hypothetical protein
MMSESNVSLLPPIGCKWCRRPWSTPNPILKNHAIFTTLERRRERGRECKVCPNVLFKDYPECKRAGLLETFRTTQDEFENFASRVHTHEDRMNGVVPRQRKRKADDDEKPEAEKVIKGRQGNYMKGETNLGIFWPLGLAGQHHPTMIA